MTPVSTRPPRLGALVMGHASPFSTGGVYLNFAGLGADAENLRHATLGPSQQRLDRIRRTHDPEGIFETAAHQP